MKRSYWAGFVTALLVCAMMGTAYASTGKVTRELEYRNIKVALDGQELDLRNAAGDPVEPFMFDGTNYLPVRALAEALGLKVSWNGAASTVMLTSPEPEAQLQGLEPAPPEETSETASAGGETISAFMTEASAKKIALDHAGLTESAVTSLRVILESSGSGEYQVLFQNGGAEYDYHIDALSGEIINFSKASA